MRFDIAALPFARSGKKFSTRPHEMKDNAWPASAHTYSGGAPLFDQQVNDNRVMVRQGSPAGGKAAEGLRVNARHAARRVDPLAGAQGAQPARRQPVEPQL